MSKAERLLTIVNEVRRSRYVSYRGGKRSIRMTCGPGYRLEGSRCVRMSSMERRKRSRSTIRAQRKLRGKRYMINRRRQRSMRRRQRSGY
jgi:hypothetical protein